MKRAEAEEIVTGRGWLAERPADFRARLLSHCSIVRFAKGATIYSVGDPPGGLYGLIDGLLRIELPVPGLGPHIGYVARPGFWVGLASQMRRKPRDVTLVAGSEATLFYLPITGIETLVGKPEAIRHFAVLMAENHEVLLAAASDLFNPNLPARIASRLIALAGWGDDSPQPHLAPVPLTQAELAMICNVSRKTISEYASRFAKLGLITQEYGGIVINDPARLKRISDGLESIELPNGGGHRASPDPAGAR